MNCDMEIENVRTLDFNSAVMLVSEFHVSLKSLVDSINERKWLINKALHEQGREVMFNASWDSYDRDKILSTPIYDQVSMKGFAETLYMSLFDDTKIKRGKAIIISRKASDKYTLKELYYEDFVQFVNAFRNQYTHSKENMEGAKILPKDVYFHFLGTNKAPQTDEEYHKLHNGFLNEYVAFLDGILQKIQTDNSYLGRIEVDQQGNIHIAHILLTKYLTNYVGNECYIRRTVPNNDPKTQEIYPNFCYSPEYINCNIVGEVSKNEETGVCYVGDVKLDSFAEKRVGKGIRVLRVRAVNPVQNFGFSIEAMMIENVTIVKPKETPDIVSTIQTPSISEGVVCTVEIDSGNRTHVGNILIGKKHGCKRNQIVKLNKIIENVSPSKKFYPFVATEVERVDVSTFEVKVNVPYEVEIDKDGNPHVMNVYIDSQQSLKKGYWVSFEAIQDNDVSRVSKIYSQKGIVKTVIRIEDNKLVSSEESKGFWKRLLKLIGIRK